MGEQENLQVVKKWEKYYSFGISVFQGTNVARMNTEVH